uniref:Uncharacterized protein n=1 Tax=Anguilla anguilla TaxID=7936 RepID=A0A0E9V020_ANGAN
MGSVVYLQVCICTCPIVLTVDSGALVTCIYKATSECNTGRQVKTCYLPALRLPSHLYIVI